MFGSCSSDRRHSFQHILVRPMGVTNGHQRGLLWGKLHLPYTRPVRGSCSVLMLMSGNDYVYVVDIVMVFLYPRAYIDCLCCHHHHFKLKLNVTWNTTGPTVQSMTCKTCTFELKQKVSPIYRQTCPCRYLNLPKYRVHRWLVISLHRFCTQTQCILFPHNHHTKGLAATPDKIIINMRQPLNTTKEYWAKLVMHKTALYSSNECPTDHDTLVLLVSLAG